MANGLPPGLAGYVAYNQLADQREANQMGMLSRLMGLQQAQRAQQMQEAQFRENQELAPLRRRQIESQIAATEGDALRKNQRMQAQGALSNLLMGGGYAQTTGAAAPDAVAMNEQDALRQVMEATAQGRPMTVDVPNPQRVQALATMAAPEQAMTAMLRNIYPEQPKPAAPTALSRLMAERDALPINDPRRGVYDAAISRQTAPSTPTTVVNMPGQEKEFQKAVGKEFGQIYTDTIKAELNAPKTIANYDRLGGLLNQVNTGAFAGNITALKAAAKAMGFDLTAMGIRDDVAPAQATRQISNMLALELRNPAGGAGMPGAMSDKDREFLQQSIPSIENDPGAIGQMIDYRKRIARRDQEVGALARQYRARAGTFDEGFFDELRRFSDANPLFPQAPTAPARPTAGSAPATGVRFLGFENAPNR